MDSLITQLDKKYQDFNGSFSDRAYKFSFDYAYAYFEILEQQPRLKEIIGKDKENNQGNSLSFYYAELHRDIYLPMSKYKVSHFTPPQDIIGDTQIYPHFRLMISLWLAKHIVRLFPFLKTKDRDFNSYVAIQKIIHNIRQKKYQIYFIQLHQALIPLILKISSETDKGSFKIDDTRIKIFIDDKKGIFKADNDQLSYPIKRKTKRMKLIKHLVGKDDCGVVELAKETNQFKETIMKEITEINRLFRHNLDVADDLIIHHDTGGYSLNKKSFDITLN